MEEQQVRENDKGIGVADVTDINGNDSGNASDHDSGRDLDDWGNDLKTEGRLLTLEYEDFFFINCYFPSPLRNRRRYDYRTLWDRQFKKYVSALVNKKPVIIGGDFNVTLTSSDAHNGSTRTDEDQEVEREAIGELMNLGFLDAYRLVHPHRKHVYSWWSGKDKNRSDNRGRRLDYFLVSGSIAAEVKEAAVMMEIHGSDHCPISLSVRLHIAQSYKWAANRTREPVGRSSERKQHVRIPVRFNPEQRTAFIEGLPRYCCAAAWNCIDWNDSEHIVAHMQREIALAAINRDAEAVSALQAGLIRSIDARSLAVRHVVSADSIPGIDGVKWKTAAEKMEAVLRLGSSSSPTSPTSLISPINPISPDNSDGSDSSVSENSGKNAGNGDNSNANHKDGDWGDRGERQDRQDRRGYKASPVRIIKIQSKNGKIRHIHINTWFDRAMQALHAMALDPVSEACADRTSFAFRKGRSHLDLHYYLERAFLEADWAFVADVRQCYERISHDWILNHIPLPRRILSEFLNAGFILEQELYRPDVGVGIGMNISPIIANMVLDGLQEHIRRSFYPGAYLFEEKEITFWTSRAGKNKTLIDYGNGHVYRYADDIIITVKTKEDAERARELVKAFLEPRGLELSPAKSRIVNVNEGFTFMSRTYIKKHGRVFSYPSEAATALFMKELRDTVSNHTGSQKRLIETVNRKLTGWATYHKIGNAEDTFAKIDTYLKTLLLEYCEAKHPRWSRDRILERYWFKDEKGIYHFALPNKREVQVKSLIDTVFLPHRGIWVKANPYLDTEYINWRAHSRSIRAVTGPYRKIWDKQKGRCYYCGGRLLADQERVLVIVNPGARSRIERFGYIHMKCAHWSPEYVRSDLQPESNMELMYLLKRLSKFRELSEFFQKATKPTFTIGFAEMEEKVAGVSTVSTVSTVSVHRSNSASKADKATAVSVDGRDSEDRRGSSRDSNNVAAGEGTVAWWKQEAVMKCWIDNGYEIKKVDTKKKRITFQRIVAAGTAAGASSSPRATRAARQLANLEIPEILTTRKIPEEAKYELENYFKYIVKKYELR